MNEQALAQAALQAMQQAYAPYSDFKVGAALLTTDGRVFTGCNVENASFSTTVCAERTAVFKAVSEGARDFRMLAVVGGKGGDIRGVCPPCGVCRQVLAEFCPPDFPLLLVRSPDAWERITLGELLPHSFALEDKA